MFADALSLLMAGLVDKWWDKTSLSWNHYTLIPTVTK